jgi:large subunit ribosomal protein L18
LALSGKPRLVARSTLKNVVAQIIVAKPHGDEVLVSAHSRELKKYEWKAPSGNLPAAYLTGLLCGLKAKAQGLEEVILDIGLNSPSKGARVFAVLKGVLDAGVNVSHSEEKLPDEKRIQGEHMAQYAESLASNPEEYQSKFSKYLEQKLPPEDLPKHFAKVKTEISAAFKSGGKKT